MFGGGGGGRAGNEGGGGGEWAPDGPPKEADQPQTRCTASCGTPVRSDRPAARVRRADVKKWAAWCMIRVSAVHFLDWARANDYRDFSALGPSCLTAYRTHLIPIPVALH